MAATTVPPISVKKTASRLCAGIDPGPTSWDDFREAVARHGTLLRANPHSFPVLKPNLAFFLAHGASGLSLLEELVSEFVSTREIILDCKANEIANSLEAWLRFAFSSLKVTGITVNPFLGEKTIELAASFAAKYASSRARVYVLCATSEQSAGPLAFLQDHPERIILTCKQIRESLFAGDKQYQNTLGVVIGANRQQVLKMPDLAEARLPVLAPGLGAQGADWNILQECASLPNEITFPLSRGIFGGGTITEREMQARLQEVQEKFAATLKLS